MPHSKNRSKTENKTKTLKERILIFLKQENICKNQFYKKTGIANGTLDKKSGITGDSIAKINNAYPNLNLEWLISGKGSILKSKFELYASHLQEQELNDIKITSENNNNEVSISAEMETKLEFTPIYTYRDNQKLEGYLSIPKANNCDGAGYVDTDSMYPLIKPGDIICYKTSNDTEYIHWGEMYALYLKLETDEILTIKYVQKSDLGDDYIQLVSHNQEYNPKDIPKTDILWKAIIKVSIRYNSIL